MGTAPQTLSAERFQADLQNPERATRQTVERMARHIKDGASDTGVVSAARDVVRRFAGAQTSRGAICWAVWWAAKHFVKFVQDETLFNRQLCLTDGRCITVPGSDELEMLVSPGVMIRMKRPQGDCDDFTDVQLAMLRALGVPYRIVTVKANPRVPDEWSHVYGLAILEDGSAMPMDASHGKFPGWQVPKADVLQYQEWDQDGRPVAPIARPAKTTLHGYQRGVGRLRGGRGMRGIVCPTSDSCYDDGTGYDSGGSYSNLQPATSGADTATGFLTAGAPSQLPGIFGNLASAWTSIAGRVIAPQTVVTRGANGQLYYSTPGSGSVPASLTAFGATSGGISGSTIAFLGGAALLLILMGKK